jgi:bifunctional non-homologous end joining protein LigD
VFYAFDVLHVKGRDVTAEPLTKRRGRLPAILGENTTVRLSQALPGRAETVLAAVRAAGFEGVIAKRKDSLYQPGERSSDWVRCGLSLEGSLPVAVGRTNRHVDATFSVNRNRVERIRDARRTQTQSSPA